MQIDAVRKGIRLTAQLCVLILGAVVAGMLALTLIFMLPTEVMKEHVASSIDIFYTESVYPQQVQGYKSTQLDNETDAIMLLGAIHETETLGPMQQAAAVPHATVKGENSKCVVLKNYLWDGILPDGESNYDRYWHGYMLYLKPLLLLMDYADIRVLNMIVQVFVLLLLLRELVRRKLDSIIVPLGLFVAVVNPVATAMSLQFSSIYYIVLFSLLVLVRYGEKILADNRIYFFFTLVGIGVAYFDFLTYPIAAFVVPASAALFLDEKDWKEKILNIVKWGLCWGLGYAGMWAGKWIIGSIILDVNVIAEAFGRVNVHSGKAVQENGDMLSSLQVLWKNIKVLLRWPYILLGAAVFIFYEKKVIFGLNRRMFLLCLPFAILCLIPCLWIALLKSHSLWCYWYSYRNLGSTAFAAGIMMEVLSFSAEKKKRLDRRG